MDEVLVRCLLVPAIVLLFCCGVAFWGLVRAERRRREREAALFHSRAKIGPIVRFSDIIPLKVPPPGYDYACTDCGKGLTGEEADRHLVADWPHCDDCWQELCDSLDEYHAKEGIDR